jgi:DeoR/GlpR family transcriptional regulator of sugar metabolism
MTKKPHWTRTAEGKAKMSRVQKAAWAKRRETEATELQEREVIPHENKDAMRELAQKIIKEAKAKTIENGHMKMQSWMQFCPYCGQVLGGKWKR